jgi:SnoaL-like protein
MSVKSAEATSRRAPADPQHFVADAERMTNERDVESIDTVFSPIATWTSVIDGLVITANGRDEIRDRWAVMCRFMAARRMVVNKRLVTSDAETIVNEWTGSLGGRTSARGIEVWHFDDHGRVDSQRLYGFLNTGPDTSALQSLRMLAGYPVTASTFALMRLTSGKASR